MNYPIFDENGKVICQECGKSFNQIQYLHLKYSHNMTLDEYKRRYKGLPLTSISYHDFRSLVGRKVISRYNEFYRNNPNDERVKRHALKRAENGRKAFEKGLIKPYGHYNIKERTKQEIRLGKFLKPLGFKEQQVFNRVWKVNYIVDFVNYDIKLVIEVDGKSHLLENVRGRDKIRDEWFNSIGYRVIRFTNDDIDRSFERVKDRVMGIIQELKLARKRDTLINESEEIVQSRGNSGE